MSRLPFDAPEFDGSPLCAETDPDAFHPDHHRSSVNAEMRRIAKRICGMCEVRQECLQWALDEDERYGIWGGLTEKERARVARGGPMPPPPPVRVEPPKLPVRPVIAVPPTPPVPRIHARLTADEKELIRQRTAEGWSLARIATLLGVTPRSVARVRAQQRETAA